jgi:hypothetical protein
VQLDLSGVVYEILFESSSLPAVTLNNGKFNVPYNMDCYALWQGKLMKIPVEASRPNDFREE